MANEEHLAILEQGVEAWNAWRKENPDKKPDLTGANLTSADLSGAILFEACLIAAQLGGANLRGADLRRALLTLVVLSGADLREADLRQANLLNASLREADLSGANLHYVILTGADLSEADLTRADLSEADLHWANLHGASLREADLSGADLHRANLTGADLYRASLGGAQLRHADLTEANLQEADLLEAMVGFADLTRATTRTVENHLSLLRRSEASTNPWKASGGHPTEQVAEWNEWRRNNAHMKPCLDDANLSGLNLSYANFRELSLRGADFSCCELYETDFVRCDLTDARFVRADLYGALLDEADLSNARLMDSNLKWVTLVQTTLKGADISRCRVYGASPWRANLDGAVQTDLVVSRQDEAKFTVDDLEIAHLTNLLLHHKKMRNVIDMMGEKMVLILGRFGERKKVLDALVGKLKEAGFIPMVFDFERAESQDFTQTVKAIAGMSAFIVADITNPRSVQQELQATIPDYMIPFVPIIQEGQPPYSMFVDFLKKYDKWVLSPLKYSDLDQLERITDTAIIQPALERREYLLGEKGKELDFRPGEDYETV